MSEPVAWKVCCYDSGKIKAGVEVYPVLSSLVKVLGYPNPFAVAQQQVTSAHSLASSTFLFSLLSTSVFSSYSSLSYRS